MILHYSITPNTLKYLVKVKNIEAIIDIHSHNKRSNKKKIVLVLTSSIASKNKPEPLPFRR